MVMKKKFISASNWLLSLTMAAVGFSGCSGGMVMYGTPSANFKVSGKVTDVDGRGIAGIEVTTEAESLQSEEPRYITDLEGRYCLNYESFPTYDTVLFWFRDIDAELDGSFVSRSAPVRFQSYLGTSGSWYRGKAEAVLDVVMEAEPEVDANVPWIVDSVSGANTVSQ